FLVAISLPSVERPAFLGDDREPDDHRVAIVLQAAHVVDDDPFEPREGIADAQHLVGLFLVLREDEARLAVLEDAPHLIGQAVDEDPERDRPRRLGGQLDVEPGRPVPGDDRHPVTALEAEPDEAQAHRADLGRVLLPGHLLPDAVLLLAQRDLGPAPPSLGDESPRECSGLSRHRLRSATSKSSPRYAFTTTGSSWTSAGAPSAIFLPKSST